MIMDAGEHAGRQKLENDSIQEDLVRKNVLEVDSAARYLRPRDQGADDKYI